MWAWSFCSCAGGKVGALAVAVGVAAGVVAGGVVAGVIDCAKAAAGSEKLASRIAAAK
jgi:hypothetical protein